MDIRRASTCPISDRSHQPQVMLVYSFLFLPPWKPVHLHHVGTCLKCKYLDTQTYWIPKREWRQYWPALSPALQVTLRPVCRVLPYMMLYWPQSSVVRYFLFLFPAPKFHIAYTINYTFSLATQRPYQSPLPNVLPINMFTVMNLIYFLSTYNETSTPQGPQYMYFSIQDT